MEKAGTRNQRLACLALVLALTTYLTSAKLLNISKPQFPSCHTRHEGWVIYDSWSRVYAQVCSDYSLCPEEHSCFFGEFKKRTRREALFPPATSRCQRPCLLPGGENKVKRKREVTTGGRSKAVFLPNPALPSRTGQQSSDYTCQCKLLPIINDQKNPLLFQITLRLTHEQGGGYGHWPSQSKICRKLLTSQDLPTHSQPIADGKSYQ